MEQVEFKDPFEGTPKAAKHSQYGLDNETEYEQLQNCLLFEKDGLLGLKDENGTIICEPEYLQIEKCTGYIFFYQPNHTYKYVYPGGSESGYMPEEERPYIVNGKYGLKDKDGRIILEPIYDIVCEWGNCDVIYTLRGEEYHYYNHQGEEILTGVRPIDVYTEIARTCPYYLSEEQNTGQLVTQEIVSGPIDNHCCQLDDGMWVRLDRITREEVREIMGGGELISMSKHAFDDFYSRDTYIYSAYIAKGKGKNCIEDCLDQFQKMGCYNSSWLYITRVWVSPKSSIPFDKIGKLWTKFKNLQLGRSSLKKKINFQDLTNIAVGIDPSLAADEIRMMQVIYFRDRWPSSKEFQWSDALKKHSLDDLRQAYADIQLLYDDIRNDDKCYADWLIKDILSGSIPCNDKPQWTWEEEEQINHFLHFVGFECTTTLTQMFAHLTEAQSTKITKSHADFLLKKTEWLLAHGSRVNAVIDKRTLLDMLSCPSISVEAEAAEPWARMIEIIKTHGALSSEELRLRGVDLVLAEYKFGCVHPDQIKSVFGVNVFTEIP